MELIRNVAIQRRNYARCRNKPAEQGFFGFVTVYALWKCFFKKSQKKRENNSNVLENNKILRLCLRATLTVSECWSRSSRSKVNTNKEMVVSTMGFIWYWTLQLEACLNLMESPKPGLITEITQKVVKIRFLIFRGAAVSCLINSLHSFVFRKEDSTSQ